MIRKAELLDRASLEDRSLLEIYVDEANFFWEFLRPLLLESKPRRTLEIGSGVGLLSLFSSTEVKSITSLEPESSGFGKMAVFRKLIVELWSEQEITDFRDCYLHELQESERFDFIYCINVLEHVPEPDKLISEIYDRLNPRGTAWCVLPNYSFPYEQHFEIPILISKSLTEKVFRKKIRKHALSPDPKGLWSELSWPTQKGLRRFLVSSGISHEFRKTVLGGYFDRLDEPQFVARKGTAYKFLRPMIRILKPLILALPHRIQPVIEFTISKPHSETPSSRIAN